MKHILLLLALFEVTAMNTQNSEPVYVDTITRGEKIYFDSTVTSYQVDYVCKGQSITVRGVGNCYTYNSKCHSGTVLYISEIVSESPTGEKKKHPPVKYLVK